MESSNCAPMLLSQLLFVPIYTKNKKHYLQLLTFWKLQMKNIPNLHKRGSRNRQSQKMGDIEGESALAKFL